MCFLVPVLVQSTLTITCCLFLKVQWADIESGYRANLQVLGFNESMWDSGQKLPIDYLSWNEMSLEERFTLTSIGISQEEWDAAEPGNHFPFQPVPSTDIVEVVTSSPTRRPTQKPSQAVSLVSLCSLYIQPSNVTHDVALVHQTIALQSSISKAHNCRTYN